MADIVRNVLDQKDDKFKSTDVLKSIDLEIDLGNLLAIDTNPLDLIEFRDDRDAFLKDLARDNTQILFNSIWKLPIVRQDEVIIAKLPVPTTRLPREKPIPKPKPLTKWKKYAQLKGIKNSRKPRLVWDEQLKEWRPHWGYKKANSDDKKDWLIEVPANADPYEDQFAKRNSEKKERVSKNELQRLRNIARSQNIKVPGIGLTPNSNPSRDQVGKALALAKVSTASLGRFTKNLPKEKTKSLGQRRKFESNLGSMAAEKKRTLELWDKMNRKNPTLDVSKAVNQQIFNQEQEASEKKKGGKNMIKQKNKSRQHTHSFSKKGHQKQRGVQKQRGTQNQKGNVKQRRKR